MGGQVIDVVVDGQGEVVPGYYGFGPSVYTLPGTYSRAMLFPARFSLASPAASSAGSRSRFVLQGPSGQPRPPRRSTRCCVVGTNGNRSSQYLG